MAKSKQQPACSGAMPLSCSNEPGTASARAPSSAKSLLALKKRSRQGTSAPSPPYSKTKPRNEPVSEPGPSGRSGEAEPRLATVGQCSCA
jgi:hypothetical protein